MKRSGIARQLKRQPGLAIRLLKADTALSVIVQAVNAPVSSVKARLPCGLDGLLLKSRKGQSIPPVQDRHMSRTADPTG